MSKVYLKLEVQDKYGTVIKVFTKEVYSDFTPVNSMIFGAEDYTLVPRNIYFDLNDGSILVRFVETPHEGFDVWDFLLKDGWSL